MSADNVHDLNKGVRDPGSAGDAGKVGSGDPGSPNTPDKGSSADDSHKVELEELRSENRKLADQLTNLQTVLGRQGAELGDLREAAKTPAFDREKIVQEYGEVMESRDYGRIFDMNVAMMKMAAEQAENAQMQVVRTYVEEKGSDPRFKDISLETAQSWAARNNVKLSQLAIPSNMKMILNQIDADRVRNFDVDAEVKRRVAAELARVNAAGHPANAASGGAATGAQPAEPKFKNETDSFVYAFAKSQGLIPPE